MAKAGESHAEGQTGGGRGPGWWSGARGWKDLGFPCKRDEEATGEGNTNRRPIRVWLGQGARRSRGPKGEAPATETATGPAGEGPVQASEVVG